MALLHEAVDEKKFDVRVVERNITKGVVSAEDAQKAADKLPDDSENAQYVSVEALLRDESESLQH
ncbi:MAG TPA: hypothetical protein VM598_02485 [Bdellovibrionota bacterium]|jgi:hypothetical protein|nr:hypothetical protein [Bdellovibrionota bacterium]